MSLITPSNRRGQSSRGAHKGGGGRRNENNKIYAHPLPIIFSEPPSNTATKSILGLLGLSLTQVLNPHCEGIFDPATRSVWITNQKDSTILWRRGFFGKGDLSRSEPSWLARQIKNRKAAVGNRMTSEEMREKRRAERKQFKIDRAKAIAAAAAEAEAIFATEGRVVVPAISGPEIPSAATWRPTVAPQPEQSDFAIEPKDEDENLLLLEDEEEPPEDIEHLQLTLAEAFFLSWYFDCLTVLDPETNEAMSIQHLWNAFQALHVSPISATIPVHEPRFDNPFLVQYVVNHHYRSLGWIVKGGIKFCVDYLLYKRGPVFSHAEFAIVVCPVYEDPADQESSPFHLPNSSPFGWHWLSTINRVNSQVQKMLVLAYVTIPSMSRVSSNVLDSPACLPHYSVREVVVRRFLPARMRD